VTPAASLAREQAAMLADFPLRLGLGGNDRKHWRAADRQKKAEKQATAWALAGKPKPALPCVVTITRVSPGNGMDDDGVPSACKYVRDEVARWLGVDDKHADIVRYEYAQHRGPWGVRIEVRSM
jgi:hypothetical protein